jgi:putative membrane-bound dehydrogenase-like protein
MKFNKVNTSDVKRDFYIFSSLLILVIACQNNKVHLEQDPISSFELADGFQIELIASEPLIADPVAMEIDEYGNMYVVEMHGYPLDKSGSGNVKLLKDADGDGTMDHSIVFADNLKFPTGIMRWKRGVLVTDPPNLLYFADTDGDDRADVRDTVLTGFAVSNPQHNFNTPMFGLDNWIYLSNEPATTPRVYTEEFSDLGNDVRYLHSDKGPVLPPNGGGRRVRLKPDELKLEAMSSAGQFGQSIDPWGRHFLVSNANHIFHEVVREEYLKRNPDLLVSNATVSISDHGAAAEVYPITLNPEHQLLTDLGVFTAACGITAYTGGLFPEPFNEAVFVAEPVGNIVHVDVVKEKGAAFTASRMYEGKEFLASTDPWFRPVNHYVGPDGALYIVDYYRRVIEHPEWMAEDAATKSNLYDGIDKGRIFRITPTGTAAATWTRGMDLGEASDSNLVKALEHTNLWFRRHAQRLLLDRNKKEVIPELREMVRSGSNSYGRLHAAWTLEGLAELGWEEVAILLRDPEPGVRENALRLAEPFLGIDNEKLKDLIPLGEDVHGTVRFQLLCTLGEVDTPLAREARERMLFEDLADPWIQIAALSARNPDYNGLLNTAVSKFEAWGSDAASLVQRLADMLAAGGNIEEVKRLINQSMSVGRGSEEGVWQAAVLRGLAQRNRDDRFHGAEMEYERDLLLESIFSDRPLQVRRASLEFLGDLGVPQGTSYQKAVDTSHRLIGDREADPAERGLAVGFVALAEPETSMDRLVGLLNPNEPVEIQRTVLETLGSKSGTELLDLLIDEWPSLTPGIREQAIGLFMASEERRSKLVEALEAGTIDPSAVSWPRQVGLMAQADVDLRRRSRRIFADPEARTDKREVMETYQKALSSGGDVVTGKAVYMKNCSVCHQIGEQFGTAYGPDLASIRTRRPESVLTDILDPNLSIADGYDLWDIKLINGETIQGIIGSETTGSITLRIYGAEDEVLSRQDIESLNALNMSIMPAGLESQISPDEMRDLLAFIRKPN